MGRPDLRRLEEPGATPRSPERSERREKRGARGESRGRSTRTAPTAKISEGDRIEGTVTHITEYGAFVELAPGVTGLVHISALSDEYVRRVQDVVKQGDRMTVEVLNIDDRGRYKLRRILPDAEGAEEAVGHVRDREEEKDALQFEDRW